MARIAAIDFGNVRIGIALSDENQILARDLTTIRGRKTHELTIEDILTALKEYQPIESFVVGLPLHLSGDDSEMTKKVRAFANVLEKLSEKPVELWDERLTSMQVERALKEQSMNRKKRAKVVDQLSAALILQSFLDAKGFRS